MDEISNYLKAQAGNHLSHSDYVDLGLKISEWMIECDERRDAYDDRLHRVEDACLAVWADEQGGTLSAEQVQEMIRVIRGDVAPDDANLPEPSMSDYDRSVEKNEHLGNVEKNGPMHPTVTRNAGLMKTHPETWWSCRMFPERNDEARQIEARKEAEYIYQAFLRGEPLSEQDLQTLQLSRML